MSLSMPLFVALGLTFHAQAERLQSQDDRHSAMAFNNLLQVTNVATSSTMWETIGKMEDVAEKALVENDEAKVHLQIGEDVKTGVDGKHENLKKGTHEKVEKTEDNGEAMVEDSRQTNKDNNNPEGYEEGTPAFWSKNSCITVPYCVDKYYLPEWENLQAATHKKAQDPDADIPEWPTGAKDPKDICTKEHNELAELEMCNDKFPGCSCSMMPFMENFRKTLNTKYKVALYADFQDKTLIDSNGKWKDAKAAKDTAAAEKELLLQKATLTSRVQASDVFLFFKQMNTGDFCEAERKAVNVEARKGNGKYSFDIKPSFFFESFKACMTSANWKLKDKFDKKDEAQDRLMGDCMAGKFGDKMKEQIPELLNKK